MEGTSAGTVAVVPALSDWVGKKDSVCSASKVDPASLHWFCYRPSSVTVTLNSAHEHQDTVLDGAEGGTPTHTPTIKFRDVVHQVRSAYLTEGANTLEQVDTVISPARILGLANAPLALLDAGLVSDRC